MTEATATYDRVLAHFNDLVDSIAPDQWSLDTPCEGWTIRDLLVHLIVRNDRLAATVGGSAEPEPSSDTDLVAEWHKRVDWWAEGMADPARASVVWPTAMGELTFTDTALRMNTGELTIHTWDLARALGVDDTLDPEAVRTSLAGMQAYGDAIRRPGAMGPAVEPPAGADEQTQLIAFTGRTV